MSEKLLVKVGLSTLDAPMTVAQARRHGNRHMPSDLKRAGFQTVVFVSDPEIHGSKYMRISYGK